MSQTVRDRRALIAGLVTLLMPATVVLAQNGDQPKSPDPTRPPGQVKETPRPRAGLTAAQTRDAVRIAAPALRENRIKVEGANTPTADMREYVVGVERLTPKTDATKPAAHPDAASEAPPRAVVTSYRYFDDATIVSVVDLATGQTTDVKTVQHMQTPLSDGEYQAAQLMAREQVDDIKALYQQFGDRIEVYPQFAQYTPDGETRVHRVVHLLYRVDKRDLSAPRPIIDLTTRSITVPKPEGGEPAAGRN